MNERVSSGAQDNRLQSSQPTASAADNIRELSDGPTVVVLILNLNRTMDTVLCVQSLLKSTYRNLRILVIDNGSSEENKEELQQGLPRGCELLELDGNRGVAAAWNLGIRHIRANSESEFVLLLNNDTVIDPTVIEELVYAANMYPDAKAFGPTVIDARSSRGTRLADAKRAITPTSDYSLSGCALLIRGVLFDEIGMFDEDYFVYGEEADFLERMRRASLKSLRVPTNGEVFHKGSQTSSMMTGFEAHYRSRNALMFAGKNLRGYRMLSFILDFFLRYQIRGIARDLRAGNIDKTVVPRIRGITEGAFIFMRFAVTAPHHQRDPVSTPHDFGNHKI